MTEPTTYRLDKEIKENAYAVFQQLGLKPSQAVNLFLSQVALRGGIPFDLSTSQPNAETQRAFAESDNPEQLPAYKDFASLRHDIDV